MERDIVIVGGGAAGFFTAINLAEKNTGKSILILEKTNQVLSKVKVSGGGRCNLTHACFDPGELVENYPRGEKELLGPFFQFATGDTIAWFSERGVELKIEEDGRMFPVSDSSQTIIDCFMKLVKKLNIEIQLSTEVLEVSKMEQFNLTLKGGKQLKTKFLVIATGGSQKLRHYDLIKETGHTLHTPIPSLFTFNLPKHPSNELMGLATNATVSIKGTKYEEYGPVLFTHWGMSGPTILKLSSKAAKLLYRKSYQFEFEIEWLENATDYLIGMRKNKAKQSIGKSKVEGIPNRLWLYFIKRSDINPDKNWADLNKQELETLRKTLEKDTYTANGKTTFKEEFVSCGGVELKELTMQTMESKLHPNLYFCGEVINVDALTGGFNFQAAWTGGFLVSEAIADKLK